MKITKFTSYLSPKTQPLEEHFIKCSQSSFYLLELSGVHSDQVSQVTLFIAN